MKKIFWIGIVMFAVRVHAAPPDRQLPYMAGETWWCSQGWYGNVSHQSEKAWDFNWGSGSNDLGKPILAPSDGIIVYNGNTGGAYGKVVLIEYDDETYDRIAHCHSMVAVLNEPVRQGQVIAFCGRSGTGAVHIHINNQTSGDANSKGIQSAESHFHYLFKGKSEWGIPPCCECPSGNNESYQATSKNTFALDRAYTENGGEEMVGRREYEMWDLGRARQANPNHPWYHSWNPNDLYRRDAPGVPKNCYIQHLDGGFFWDSAIVYDGLGGARSAYVLHSGFWVEWTKSGGPTSSLGMPITNEYETASNPKRARQDFQLGYLEYIDRDPSVNEITLHPYPVCAPGWTAQGWNPTVSYRIAEIYTREGAWLMYGDARSTAIHDELNRTWIQAFAKGTITIPDVYDPSEPGFRPQGGASSDYVAFTGLFNEDQTADIGLYDRNNGTWQIAFSDVANRRFVAQPSPWLIGWGIGPGVYNLLTGDFSGDGYTDLCLYNESLGRWAVAYNQGDHFEIAAGPGPNGAWIDQWAVGDGNDWIPFTADFSGDGANDIGVFYPTLGRWFIAFNQGKRFEPSNGPFENGSWLDGYGQGTIGDYLPFAASLSGDAYGDIAVHHPKTGRWWVAFNWGRQFIGESGPGINGCWLDQWGITSGTPTWLHFLVPVVGDPTLCDLLSHSPTSGNMFAAQNLVRAFTGIKGPGRDGALLEQWSIEDGTKHVQILAQDFSGDGFADLVSYTPKYGRWFVAYNWGQSFRGEGGPDTNGSWLNGWGVE